ncbi:hypothetical protein Lgee_0999 [Legionella geestiana]|uniref:Uncharacterized protein n=1 Tax=Legionella geestiana TaxID=45065 RepID=A0A0W0TZ46_9GAMM|nr:hypothetical protein [Legionella geestiana]KTD00735.1 hypothetical protein Lgee_0999 [Legionella geestiana]QBS11592.1 hypothetical protein E4T54_01920 [Legionella geestiana]QDQ40799.1 hypothetical protein E3226_010515 [Legionella geestiana]STX53730.1 Uncharacterised protein [Legionella geestiana]
MGLQREFDEIHHYSNDYSFEEDIGDIEHKKRVRRRLEERLDRKRLEAEFDELDGDFDWDDWDRP